MKGEIPFWRNVHAAISTGDTNAFEPTPDTTSPSTWRSERDVPAGTVIAGIRVTAPLSIVVVEHDKNTYGDRKGEVSVSIGEASRRFDPEFFLLGATGKTEAEALEKLFRKIAANKTLLSRRISIQKRLSDCLDASDVQGDLADARRMLTYYQGIHIKNHEVVETSQIKMTNAELELIKRYAPKLHERAFGANKSAAALRRADQAFVDTLRTIAEELVLLLEQKTRE